MRNSWLDFANLEKDFDSDFFHCSLCGSRYFFSVLTFGDDELPPPVVTQFSMSVSYKTVLGVVDFGRLALADVHSLLWFNRWGRH